MQQSTVSYSGLVSCAVNFEGGIYENAEGIGFMFTSNIVNDICVNGIVSLTSTSYTSATAIFFDDMGIGGDATDSQFSASFGTSTVSGLATTQSAVLFNPISDIAFHNCNFDITMSTSINTIPAIGMNFNSDVADLEDVFISVSITGGGPQTKGVDFGPVGANHYLGVSSNIDGAVDAIGVHFKDLSLISSGNDILFVNSVITGSTGIAVLFEGVPSVYTVDIIGAVDIVSDSIGVLIVADFFILNQLQIRGTGGVGVSIVGAANINTDDLTLTGVSDGSSPGVYVGPSVSLVYKYGTITGEIPGADGVAVHFDGCVITMNTDLGCSSTITAVSNEGIPPILFSNPLAITILDCSFIISKAGVSDGNFAVGGTGTILFSEHFTVNSGDLTLYASKSTAYKGLVVDGSLDSTGEVHLCDVVDITDLVAIEILIPECAPLTSTFLTLSATDMDVISMNGAVNGVLVTTSLLLTNNLVVHESVSFLY